MHLQEVITRASHRQLKEVQADAAPSACWDWKGERACGSCGSAGSGGRAACSTLRRGWPEGLQLGQACCRDRVRSVGLGCHKDRAQEGSGGREVLRAAANSKCKKWGALGPVSAWVKAAAAV